MDFMNNKTQLFFVFDVESIGLHGEGFAAAWVVFENGKEIDNARYVSDPKDALGDDSDREWVMDNTPKMEINRSSSNHVRVDFWKDWLSWKAKGAIMAADCGWPVEARFLAKCVDWDAASQKWDGPYPFHEIASFRMAAGLDPLETVPRLESELPQHDPLADARQSARLLIEAINKIASDGI